jgi:hypothetical protein
MLSSRTSARPRTSGADRAAPTSTHATSTTAQMRASGRYRQVVEQFERADHPLARLLAVRAGRLPQRTAQPSPALPASGRAGVGPWRTRCPGLAPQPGRGGLIHPASGSAPCVTPPWPGPAATCVPGAGLVVRLHATARSQLLKVRFPAPSSHIALTPTSSSRICQHLR